MDLEYDVMWKEGNMILYLREYIEIANPAEERFDAIAESHTVPGTAAALLRPFLTGLRARARAELMSRCFLPLNSDIGRTFPPLRCYMIKKI
jgi:hypothetical protein